MLYVAIDGDDIGRKITSCYLKNDIKSLVEINNLVQSKVQGIAGILIKNGFSIIFCAADGVAGFSTKTKDVGEIFETIQKFGAPELSFSAGVGSDLKEAYIALMFAKSTGKSKICTYDEIG